MKKVYFLPSLEKSSTDSSFSYRLVRKKNREFSSFDQEIRQTDGVSEAVDLIYLFVLGKQSDTSNRPEASVPGQIPSPQSKKTPPLGETNAPAVLMRPSEAHVSVFARLMTVQSARLPPSGVGGVGSEWI